MLILEALGQYRMVRTIQNFGFFDKKWLNIFDKVLTHFGSRSGTKTIVWWYTINLKTIIFQSSKNYGSPTRITRLNVAPNMTAQSVWTKNDRILKALYLYSLDCTMVSSVTIKKGSVYQK